VLVVCAGTGTEVGKTWVGASVLATLRSAGVAVAARKPAQSFGPDDAHLTDAHVLAAATGEDPTVVCPSHRWYPVPMAPPMAAAALGRPPFTIADLVAELAWPEHPPGDVSVNTGGMQAADALAHPTLRWVETVGGVRSPLADDGDTVELCSALNPQLVVLVADAGLGTINAVLLSVAALAGHRLVTMLNRYHPSNDLHRRNLEWLAQRCHLDVVTAPSALAERLRVLAAVAR
jgi:dethiobiotin synthetase